MRNNAPINHFPPTLFSPNRSPIYGEARLFSQPASRLVTGNPSLQKGVNRISTGGGEPGFVVGHNDMPALAQDMEAKLFEDADGVLMPDTGQLGHNSDGHCGFADLEELRLVRFRCKPFPDRLLDIGESFRAGLALRMAAAQCRTTHRDAVLMLD